MNHAEEPVAADPGAVSVRLTVNGTEHVVEVEPRHTLADVLRDRLGLTGTHVGCEHGVCGACTVVVDGRPVRSCISYAVQWDSGGDIRTVEGVQDEPLVRALKARMCELHGLQCGFCTPGFLMLGRWALGGDREPDPEWVDEVVSSNICRCGCYQGIRASFRGVAEEESMSRTARRTSTETRLDL